MVDGFFPSQGRFSRNKDTTASSTLPQPPEDVLFRQKNAPIRYEEDDIYFANEHLPQDKVLPDSDLLKALHFYSSDFASKAITDDQLKLWKSLDETALIALGILVEEAARESVGQSGDLTFIAQEGESEGIKRMAWNGKSFSASVLRRRAKRIESINSGHELS